MSSESDPQSTFVSLKEYNESNRLNTLYAQQFAKKAKCSSCTYDKGYILQPVYACNTCAGDQLAGFCLSCAVNCHVNHEIIELFNKREFRCDCGNSKFRDTDQEDCEFNSEKDYENELNKYNHNFKGLYCYCDRVYDEERDEMAQCIVCEDWFHDRCMDSFPKESGAEDLGDFELVCKNCVVKCPILQSYAFGIELVAAFKVDSGCTRPISKENEIMSSIKEGKHEIHLDVETFCKRACKCDVCLEAYKIQKLEFLFNLEDIRSKGSNTDIVNFSIGDVDAEEEIDEAYDIDKIALKELSKLPRDRALTIASSFQQFTNQIISGIKEKVLQKTEGVQDENSSVIFTAEDMASVLDSIPNSLLKKRSRDEF